MTRRSRRRRLAVALSLLLATVNLGGCADSVDRGIPGASEDAAGEDDGGIDRDLCPVACAEPDQRDMAPMADAALDMRVAPAVDSDATPDMALDAMADSGHDGQVMPPDGDMAPPDLGPGFEPDNSLPDPCDEAPALLGPHPCRDPDMPAGRRWREDITPDYHPITGCPFADPIPFSAGCERSASLFLPQYDHVLFVGDEFMLPPPPPRGMPPEVEDLHFRRMVAEGLMPRLQGDDTLESWLRFGGPEEGAANNDAAYYARSGQFSVVASPGLTVAHAASLFTGRRLLRAQDRIIAEAEGESWLVVVVVGQHDLAALLRFGASDDPQLPSLREGLNLLTGRLQTLVTNLKALEAHSRLSSLRILITNPLPFEEARDQQDRGCAPWNLVDDLEGRSYLDDLVRPLLENWLRTALEQGVDVIFAREAMLNEEGEGDGFFGRRDGHCLFPDPAGARQLALFVLGAIEPDSP